VSLDRTPELWNLLEQDSITIREACGNTVRNVTASDQAGIDPDEPFDVTPYAHGVFEFFLRKPVCQDMGRKFKIAFSSSEKDTALTFMHDLGAIPRVREVNGELKRGFKVMVGGGLGAQPFLAITTHEFLEEELLIPYIESVLRVFDRYGERASRHKARIKFLIQKIGIDAFNELVKEEQKALTYQRYKIDVSRELSADSKISGSPFTIDNPIAIGTQLAVDPLKFEIWKKTNVCPQKQEGYFAVYVRILNGNISSVSSRTLIEKLRPVIADDLRVTINQGLQFRFVKAEHLEYIYSALALEGLAAAGFGSVADVTSCPGTDTCNLGISNSTGIAQILSEVIDEEYPELLYNKDIAIKISGCMNSCGQHGMASIGFHGSSLKAKGQVLPALQVLVGGGVMGHGDGSIADKVIKVPSKRGPDVLRYLLNDYKANRQNDETHLQYTKRVGEKYFYDLLKPLASLETLQAEDYIDWGQEEKYSTAIGVGECAGVMIDLIATLFLEAEEKLEWSQDNIDRRSYADGIYNAYAAFIHAAKGLLLQQGVQCNTQAGILKDFDIHFTQTGLYTDSNSIKETVLQINESEPSEEFANSYLQQAKNFVAYAKNFREQLVLNEKAVV
jgi:sulfite reductase (ferredoxin)